MQTPVAFTLTQIASDRWARATVRRVLRAVWLGGCLFCCGVGLALFLRMPVPVDLLLAGALLIVLLGLVRSLRPTLPPEEVARRLDRRFSLREQLATALEVERGGGTADSGVALRLTELAEATVGVARDSIRRREPFPWSDAIAAAALLVVGLGMYLLWLPPQPIFSNSGRIPQLAQAPDPNSLPPVPPEQNVTVPGDGPGAAADPRVTSAIADALRGQGATRQAAEALDRGDTSAAAQQLRALADQADQLSQASREDLARRLQQAARQVDPRDSAAAQQLRRSAEAIQRGGQNAAQGLEGLASALEGLSQGQQAQQGNPGGQGQGSQAGGAQGGQNGPGGGTQASNNGATEQRQGSHDRLNVEGQAVQLDAQGSGNQGKGPNNQPPTSSAGMGGVRGGQSSSAGATGSDPLRVPFEDRDVVQDYFSK